MLVSPPHTGGGGHTKEKGGGGPPELKTETARPIRSYGLFFFLIPGIVLFLSTLVCHRILNRVPCAVCKV